MRNTKRVISMILVVCMLMSVLPLSAFAVSISDKPANGSTALQPFRGGTGGSTNFRIPGIVTLRDGTLIAISDARWSTNVDAGGLDTIVSVSKDNGATWTYTFANYLGDNGDVYNAWSSCFIDPAIATDGTTAYLIADLFPAGVTTVGALYTAQTGSTGFNDAGNLLLRSDSDLGLSFGDTGYAASAAAAEHNYYLSGGKIYTTAGEEVAGYSVDPYFNITGTDADGNEVNTNLFFEDSPYKPFPTNYLYMTTSDDGLEWSEPTLLNLKDADENALLVGPGSGICVDGKMVFTAYEYSGSAASQRTCLIWRDTEGNWTRSEAATADAWSSEASVVDLGGGKLRVFYRDGNSYLSYSDFNWSEDENNYVRDTNATSVATAAAKRAGTGCMLSAFRYSQQIEGKDVILVSTPANSGARDNGYLYVFLVDPADKSMELAFAYDITPNQDEDFAYSCITEMNNGNIALLWESHETNPCAITFSTIDMDEVTAKENDIRLTWVDTNLWLGESVTYTDYTGNYSGADLSSLDTDVATVEVNGNSITAAVGSRMSDSATVVLDNCLYTFTSTGTADTYYISTTLSDGTTVYVEPYSTTVGLGCPNVEGNADTLAVQVLAGLEGNQVKLYGNGSLHFHYEKETPNWNRCGNDTTGGCNVLLLYRPAEEDETSSEEIPGYVQISRTDIVSGGQYLIAAQNNAGNTYVLNPVSSTNSADHMAKVTGEQTITTSEITFNAVAVGETQVQIGSVIYTVTVSEKPAVEIEVKVNESTSFTIDGEYDENDVTGLDTDVATVELVAVGDSVTYGELRDTANAGTQVTLADCAHTFTANEDGTYNVTIEKDDATWYVRPVSWGYNATETAVSVVHNSDGSVYINNLHTDGKYQWLYVNRSTLTWDRVNSTDSTTMADTFKPQCTFYIYGQGEDDSSPIPGYKLITSADEITSGNGYLIAFYDANGQLYVMNPTTRVRTTAYNQMAAVVNGLENAITTVTITGVAEGTTSMDLAGTEYNITVHPEDYDPIAIPEAEYVYQGPAISLGQKPANGTTQGQPFPAGTGGSTYFRIPGIVTLDNGTLVASTDARWNHSGDGAGLDTIVSVSTDNGANWEYTFANYLGDNGNTYNNLSTSFIDPAVGTDGTTVYMIADLFPAGIALNTSKYAPVVGENGFDDNGNLLLRDLAGDTVAMNGTGYNTMAAARAYNYYLDLENYEIYTVNGTLCEGFEVDEFFNISYTDAAGTTHSTNLFCADSPFQPYPTDYLYLTTSENGLDWTAPTLLNLQSEEEQTLLVGPGNGTYNETTGHMVFTAYRHTGGASGTAYECTSLIWMDADGNWHRTEDATVNFWSSEASVVALADGTLRVFYRDGYNVLYYTDFVWSDSANNYVRDTNATEVATTAVKDDGCQLTAITYSGTIEDKEAIIVATPANPASRRTDGHLYVFLVNEDNTMELAYDYDIVPDTIETYAYSCVTELNNGNLGLLWESQGAALTYTEIDMNVVTERDNNARLNFVDVTVFTGESVTVSDSTGDYTGADTSELDTTVATVDLSAASKITMSAQLGSDATYSGALIDLASCLYTFAQDDSGNWTINSGDVYLNTNGTLGYPNSTEATTFTIEASTQEEGSFYIRGTGDSNGARNYLYFDRSAYNWNRVSTLNSNTTWMTNCSMSLFRAVEGDGSGEIPGYERVTEVTEVTAGEYLIGAQGNDGNWYVAYPTTAQTSSFCQIAKVAESTTITTTYVTFSGVSKGYTEVMIGSTVYHVTVKESITKDINLNEGETYTDIIEGDNYADVDISGLDTSIVTVTMEGNNGTNAQGVALEPSTTLTTGTYVIFNTRAQKLVNSTSHTSSQATGLSLSGGTSSLDAATAVWTITAVDGGYTVQDANGKYMTIGSGAAGLSDEAQVLTIAYASGTWTLMQDSAYLNDFGGEGSTAAGWVSSAALTDGGSQFAIYAYGEANAEPSTTVTFTGVGEGTTTLTVERVHYNITVTHEHAYEAVVTAPTCTTGGYTTYTCACGDSYVADRVPALGHTFENGVCTVCGTGIAHNEATGENYTTLAKALAAAKAGDTVTLLADCAEDKVLVTPGVTLDLNGKTLTAEYVVGFNNADIVDNAGGGKLIIPQMNVVLDEDNGMVPIYDEDGYIFTQAGFAIRRDDTHGGDGIKIIAVAYPVNLDAIELLADGAADNNLQVVIELTWDNDQGTGSQKFVFTDEVVSAVYSSNDGTYGGYAKMFSMVITGIDGIENLKANIVLVSGTNTEYGTTPVAVN